MRHIHLDAVGGMAGDMFVAALLDAEPDHAAECLRVAQAVSGAPCRLVRHRDNVLAGARFEVADDGGHPGDHDHHAHTPWRDIRARLGAGPLEGAVAGHALGIFAALAEAEARVHGIAPDDVTFHEVGAVDSIADIVAAAWLIAAQGAGATWRCGPLPIGSGRVRTAHGWLPVPAPATAILLTGFATMDDGIAGERVTPTGAAILRHLGAHAPPPAGARRIVASGIGFGTRRLAGLSNVVRALVSETEAVASAAAHRELAVVEFEVDDQTPEDLAAGLDRVRALDGVHDVLQMPAFGKKGRIAAHIEVLAAPEALEAVIDTCFRETCTIGLRTHLVQGRALRREMRSVSVGDRTVRVKWVERPDGPSGKAESDDLRDVAGASARALLRRAAEGDAP